MTKEELSNHDEEVAHLKADRILLEYINVIEITQHFNDIQKWYA